MRQSPRFTRKAARVTQPTVQAARLTDRQQQTTHTRLAASNAALRDQVAHELTADTATTSKLARHAMSSTVARQLDAAKADNIKGLQLLVKVRKFIDVHGDPNSSPAMLKEALLPPATLDVICAFDKPTKAHSIDTIRDVVCSRLIPGKPLDHTPIRNTLRALHILGLIRSTTSDARYIRCIAKHRLVPVDWRLYHELRLLANEALGPVQEEIKWYGP